MANLFGAMGRFELYSIEIVELNGTCQDLQTISLTEGFNGWESEILYQRDDREIPLKQPLPLNDRFRPCSPYDGVIITFGKPEWCWNFRVILEGENQKDNCPMEVYVNHRKSRSCAIVRYALLTRSADASLEFTADASDASLELNLEGALPGVITILKGEIYATTATKDCPLSKRVLWSHSCPGHELWPHFCPARNCKKLDCGYPLAHGDKLKLDKSVLGLPMKSSLYVTVNLEYVETQSADHNPKQICLTKCIPVPEGRKVSHRTFHIHDIKLTLRCVWSDDIYSPWKWDPKPSWWEAAEEVFEWERAVESGLVDVPSASEEWINNYLLVIKDVDGGVVQILLVEDSGVASAVVENVNTGSVRAFVVEDVNTGSKRTLVMKDGECGSVCTMSVDEDLNSPSMNSLVEDVIARSSFKLVEE